MTPATRRTTLTAIVTIAVLIVVGAVFLFSGAYNVAATEEHTPVMRWVLNTVQTRSVSARAEHVPEPPTVDSAAVMTDGFHHYRAMCVVCHGAPGVERGEIGKGITPEPPELAHAAEELPPRELFWIVKHGIKMAGMPAFGPTHSDEEIWTIVGFVDRLPSMSGAEYAALEAAQPAQ